MSDTNGRSPGQAVLADCRAATRLANKLLSYQVEDKAGDFTIWHDEACELRLAGPIAKLTKCGASLDATLEDGRVQRIAYHPRRGFLVPRRWRKPRSAR